MSKHNNRSDPYREFRHPWGPAQGFGNHPYGPTAHFSHPTLVFGQSDDQWYKGVMSFYSGHTEVHLDPSAVHIGSLTNQHFVARDDNGRWFNIHVNHSRDGAAHIHTTPIGDSPVPTLEEMFFDAETLPPLPEIHLPGYDPTSPDYDPAQGWLSSYRSLGTHEPGYHNDDDEYGGSGGGDDSDDGDYN